MDSRHSRRGLQETGEDSGRLINERPAQGLILILAAVQLTIFAVVAWMLAPG
jgi:hypothetical protein